MSLNRELVLFYITYKLSQRNFPVDHINLSQRTEHVHGADAAPLEARLNGTLNSSSPPSQSPSATATPPVPDSTDTPLVHSTAPPSPSYPRQRSDAPPTVADAPPTVEAPPPGAVAPPTADLQIKEAVKEALRDSANEFELRFSRAFSDLHRQLHITPATAYRSFESVMDEVFRDGVNWGRVVGLFAFGGALCVECVEKEMSPLVSRIVDWMIVYLDNHIQDWITAQGGWARFAEIYGQDAAAESRRSQESMRKWLWAGATLVTGVVVGSLLAQRRL